MTHHLYDGIRDRQEALFRTGMTLAVAAFAGAIVAAVLWKPFTAATPWLAILATLLATIWLSLRLTTSDAKEHAVFMGLSQSLIIVSLMIGLSWFALIPFLFALLFYGFTAANGRVGYDDPILPRLVLAIPILGPVANCYRLITIVKLNRSLKADYA